MILFTSSSPDNSRCLPFSSSSSMSLFTYKQIGWTQCAIVCCHNNFSKQFTSTTQGHKILMLWNSWKQVPKVNKFFKTTMAKRFLAHFPAQKTRVAQMHRKVSCQENITYSSPRTAWHLIPFPQRVYGRTEYADVTTKISGMDSLPNYLRMGLCFARA